MNTVAIIGGGITGLTAAFELRQKQVPVTLYEAGGRVGGVIQSIRRDGYVAEYGPNTIMETSPKIGALIRDLGLEHRRLYSDPRAEKRYLVRGGKPVELPASTLAFLASPLFSSAAKLRLLAERYLNCSPLSQIQYPPVASVVLGFRREDVAHPLDGFGMLIPEVEGFKILGTLFSSTLFPNRAPDGHVTLTSYIGGARAPELATLDTNALVDLTLADLRAILGVTGKPTFINHVLFRHAIPQYEVGYGRFKSLMTEIEDKAPGLFLAGHYRDGISLGDSIVSGCQTAERLEKYFATILNGKPVVDANLPTLVAA